VDAAQNRIVLIVPTNNVKEPFAECTYQVDKRADIFVLDKGKEKIGKLADLTKSTQVDFLFAHLEDPQVILEIHVRPNK
jgi:hypothetical protein